ncbi:hypothetical protein TWF694_011207 [Orbilia ellipsospora]|uniref:Uncharacterized protein n=1 Tax=Orbilia ellipsospora TaxID=2528407 RepID=A0AAV9X8D1_9PEZI
MSFVPELVSTARFSNRTTVANVDGSGDAKPHESGSSESTPAQAKADSKPRFLPEPIETTRRSNRTIASGSSSPLSSNSSTPKATMLPNSANNTFESAAVLPSSGGASQKPVIPAFKSNKFSPEPVETIRRSNRAQAVEVERTRKNGWGRDSDDEETENQKKELERKNLNQAHQQRRIPAPIVGAGKSKWFPDDNNTTWGTHSSMATQQQQPSSFQGFVKTASSTSSLSPSSSSLDGLSPYPSQSVLDANVNVSDDVSSQAKSNSKATEEAISSQVRDHISSNNGDPRQFGVSANNKDAVAGIAASSNRANANTPRIARSGDDSEVAGTASLSSSPASSLKSNASGPNYLLESTSENGLASHRPSRDLTVIPSITNSQYFSPSSSLSEDTATSPQTGLKRPISPGTILIQDFAYNSSRPTPLKLPRADHASPCNWPGAASDVPKAIPENKIAQQHISHTNIQPPPRSGLTNFSSLDPSRKFDITTPSIASVAPTTVTVLRDQVLAAQSQFIKDKTHLTPTYGLNKFQPQLSSSTLSPPNGSNEPKRRKPLLPFSFIPAASRAVNSPTKSPNQLHLLSPNFPSTPLLCESPMPTTLFYESSKTNTVDYFTAKRTEKQASAMSISSNASSVVSHDTALTTPSTRASSPGPNKYGYPTASTSSMAQMVCETPKPISAERPNMCPTKRSEVTTEFVLAVFNYLSLNHESIARKFDKELSEVTGWSIERVLTDRLGALREYVEEYVERKPKFGSGICGW